MTTPRCCHVFSSNPVPANKKEGDSQKHKWACSCTARAQHLWNVKLMVSSLHRFAGKIFLRSSMSTSMTTCPLVLSQLNGMFNQCSCLLGAHPLGRCSTPKDDACSLATGQLRSNWGQPTARVCLCCSKVPTRVFSQMNINCSAAIQGERGRRLRPPHVPQVVVQVLILFRVWSPT